MVLQNFTIARKSGNTLFTYYRIIEFFDAFLIFLQSMVQFQWHDGSTKNVHVDPVILSGYQVCIIMMVFVIIMMAMMTMIYVSDDDDDD